MFYKKSLTIFFATAILAGIYFLTSTLVYDPLQVFHKAWGRKITFVNNMREQALGIINNYDFDSIIIGNSMMENSSANEASRKIGGNYVNLSTSGLKYSERHIILEYALQKKKIDRVMLLLDANFKPNDIIDNRHFTAKAYRNNKLSNALIYGSSRYAICILTMSKSKKCVGRATSMDMPGYWEDEPENARLFGGFDHWLNYKGANELKKLYLAKPIEIPETLVETFKQNMDMYILDTIEKHHQTRFDIIIPPYHMLFWRNPTEEVSFESYRTIVKYLLEETAKNSNVKFYWFYDSSFSEDISEYKDILHFSSKMNSMFTNAVAQETNVLTIYNADEKFDNLRDKINNFDNRPYLDKIKKHLDLSF